MNDVLAERKESLWRLVISPTAWAAHLMLSYITAAVWCAKYAGPGGPLQPVRWAIIAYTVIALAVITWNGWDGFRRHRHGSATLPHDADTAADRHRFLGFSTALLAALSGVATIYAAVVVLFIRSCR